MVVDSGRSVPGGSTPNLASPVFLSSSGLRLQHSNHHQPLTLVCKCRLSTLMKGVMNDDVLLLLLYMINAAMGRLATLLHVTW